MIGQTFTLIKHYGQESTPARLQGLGGGSLTRTTSVFVSPTQVVCVVPELGVGDFGIYSGSLGLRLTLGCERRG